MHGPAYEKLFPTELSSILMSRLPAPIAPFPSLRSIHLEFLEPIFAVRERESYLQSILSTLFSSPIAC